MHVAEVILAKPNYVVVGQTVEHAAKRMMVFGLSMLPVCRSEGSVVGVVTARHIVKAVASNRAAELCPIEEVMSSDFATCLPNDTTNDVYARMVTHGIEEMIVENGLGKLVGVVERSRLAAVAGPVRPVRRLRKLA